MMGGYKSADQADALSGQPLTPCFRVPPSFQYYNGTVFDVPNCAANIIGYHEMLIVGYTPSYWIVKNSWGADFGDNGYVYFARGKNLCNIDVAEVLAACEVDVAVVAEVCAPAVLHNPVGRRVADDQHLVVTDDVRGAVGHVEDCAVVVLERRRHPEAWG